MAGRERRGCGCLRIKRSYYASGSASPAPCKIEICTGIEAKAVDPLHQMTLAKRSRMGHSLPRARRDTVRFSHEYAPTNIPPKHTRAHSNGDTKPTCIDTPPLPAPTPPPSHPFISQIRRLRAWATSYHSNVTCPSWVTGRAYVAQRAWLARPEATVPGRSPAKSCALGMTAGHLCRAERRIAENRKSTMAMCDGDGTSKCTRCMRYGSGDGTIPCILLPQHQFCGVARHATTSCAILINKLYILDVRHMGTVLSP